MVESGTYDSAKAGDRVIQESLNDVAQQLKEAEKTAGNRGPADSAEEALDRTRQLADNLDSLRQKLNDKSSRPGQQGGQQANGQQQGGQQQSGQQQGGQQQGGQQQSGQQGGRSFNPGQQSPTLAGGGPPVGGPRIGDRDLNRELAERLKEAEELRRNLSRNGKGDREQMRMLDQAIQALQQMANGAYREDTETAARLKQQVIDPLRQLEMDLSKRLQAKLGHDNLRLSDEGAAPEQYRKLVEEYYKKLSNRTAP
jgi:hypothetical protein